jgi:thioredoxin-related protein
MRPLKHMALPAWIVITWTASLSAQDRIPWVTNLTEARRLAEQQNRLVLLHFWSDGCPPCQRLDQTVFNQPELVRAVTAGFVPVKINAQQSPDLAKFYRVESWPTDIVVDPSGREIYRATSPPDANRYISLLDGLKARYTAGYQTPNNAAFSQTIPSSGTALGTDTRLALDRPAQSGDFRVPTGTASPAENNTLALPQTMPSPAARPAIVENPYNNSLERERPRDTATNLSPSYSRPNADVVGMGNQLTTQSAGAAGGAWNNPNPQLAAGAYQGYQPSNAGADIGRQLNTANPPSQPQAPSWNPPAANNAASANPYAAAPSPTNRWQNPSSATSRPWETAPAANFEPAANPATPPRNASRMPELAAQEPALPSGVPPLGLDGYCPVTLMDRTRWVKGDPHFGAFHRGRTYLFTTAIEQQQFLSNPDRFSPALSGCDPVRYAETGQLVDGKREHGVFYRDRIYLFGDEASLQRFSARADYYVATVDQAVRQSTAPRIQSR